MEKPQLLPQQPDHVPEKVQWVLEEELEEEMPTDVEGCRWQMMMTLVITNTVKFCY